MYGNEEVIGEALAEILKKEQFNEKDLFITTKLWNDSHHPDHVIPALTTSMKNWDWTISIFIWFTGPLPFDMEPMPSHIEDYVPLSEIPSEVTWAQMEEAKKLGLAKHIGVSNFSVKLNSLMQRCGEMPEVNQIELHRCCNKILCAILQGTPSCWWLILRLVRATDMHPWKLQMNPIFFELPS